MHYETQKKTIIDTLNLELLLKTIKREQKNKALAI
tara:strand:- start:686 stop:790 length:105 start_codon:yes stop_codon:yes gene_type:complete